MTTVAGYTLIEQLHEGQAISLHRGRQGSEGRPAILKLVWRERATPAQLAKLRHEHDIIQSLDLPGVIRARCLEEHREVLALVLEDCGGEALANHLRQRRLSLSECLRIASELAGILGQLHDAHVLHKDINPRNIVLDAAGRVQLIDFSLAARLPREVQALANPNVLEGTLAYISPEQTGRMNRAIDHRTDLYSLGVTLYAMLTGSVPFVTRDPMELIHCHIARLPRSPSELDPGIPEAVSMIVLKLLHKAAEDRYKSAFGLRADLDECLRQLERDGRIEPFALASQDMALRFQIPEKLYGREHEAAALQDAFERAGRGAAELVLVSGYAGIGKSALIRELQRSLAVQPGFFITGKFDQLKQDIPYSAVLQALGELITQLLGESEQALASWRQALLAAVGSAGQMLVEVLPDLALVIGEQPPAPVLPPAEARNRFRKLLQDLCRAIARPGRSLVLFLDDLQWADGSSLELLASLLEHDDESSLLLIGAYRDNEVTDSHPLLAVIDAIASKGRRQTRIAVAPLPVESIAALIADTLATDIEAARPLAELIWQKTHGNPFFTGELLSELYRKGFIELDPGRRRWTWDLSAIASAPISDNVVELLATRTSSLSEPAQQALTLAACIGNRFDLHTLATVCQRSPQEVAAALEEAMMEGLLVPFTSWARYLAPGEWDAAESSVSVTMDPARRDVYRFSHDRVQQAAYSLIPEEQKRAVHLRIGRLLLECTPEKELEDRLFDIVHHLNIGAPLLTDAGERYRVAELDLRTGRRARRATAYEAAASYLAAGIALLGEECWDSHYQLSYDLGFEQAQCECWSGRLELAERRFDELLGRVRTSTDKAVVATALAEVMYTQGRLAEGVNCALAHLPALGIDIPAHPSWEMAVEQCDALWQKLGDRRIEDLIDLPRMERADMRAALLLLYRASSISMHTDPNLSFLLTVHMARISIVHGNDDASAAGYASLGIVLGPRLGRYDEAYRFGKLSYDLVERHQSLAFKPHVCAFFGHGLLPLREHIRGTQLYTRAGFDAALELGDSHGASGASCFGPNASLFMAKPLGEVARECSRALDFNRTINSEPMYVCAASEAHFIESMRGQPACYSTLGKGVMDEAAFEHFLDEVGFRFARILCGSFKVQRLFLLGSCREAAAAMDIEVESIWRSHPHYLLVDCSYYSALAEIGCLDSDGITAEARDRLLASIHRRRAFLEELAATSPDNYLCKLALVSAELARISGDHAAAEPLYQQAIDAAHQSGFLHCEGVAYELAARFYRDRGLGSITSAYLREARMCFARWGAWAKVEQLDSRYAGMLAPEPPAATDASASTDSASTSASGAFDLPSLVKASQALSSEIERDKLLLSLMNLAVENAGAERGALILERDHELCVAAEITAQSGAVVHARAEPLAEASALPVAIVQYVARTQKNLVLQDAAAEGRFIKDAYVVSRRPRSVLCMPLVHQGRVRGVLYLENNLIAGAFTPARAELLAVLCSQMAISVENADLYADLERRVIERTRALEQAQARLVKLEKEATETRMAGGFAHEMRNALTSAKLVVEKVYGTDEAGEIWSVCRQTSATLVQLYPMIRDEEREPAAALLSEVNGGQRQLDHILGSVGRALTHALAITNQILDYSRLGKERAGDSLVPLRPLLDSIIEESADDFAAHTIAVEVDIAEDSALPGKTIHFYSILKNLILNARDALIEKTNGDRRAIRITLAEERHQCVLRISDTGAGIPAEHRDKLFEPFFSTKPDTGTGLGLAVVRKLVAVHDGSIQVESELGRGTTFTIVLPRREQPLPA